MAHLTDTAPAALPGLIGRNAINKVGDPIGSVEAVWSDHVSGRAEFIGVKTGWLSGALHVIPAQGAEHDTARDVVILPYTTGQVKDAPSFDADATISDTEEAAVYRHYGIRPPGGVAPAEGASGATMPRGESPVSDPAAVDAADYTAGTGKGGYEDTTAAGPSRQGRLRKIGPSQMAS